MFSPVCVSRVRPMGAEEREWETAHPAEVQSASTRRRSGSTFGGKQLGCVRQQADTVIALVDCDRIATTARGDALVKHDFQFDHCFVPEEIDYRRARRPSMFGCGAGQDPLIVQQKHMYAEIMMPHLRRVIKEGAAVVTLVMGDTLSGKSHTVVGTRSAPGILLRSLDALLQRHRKSQSVRQRNVLDVDEGDSDEEAAGPSGGAISQIEMSIVEILDEQVRDLLNPMAPPDRRLRIKANAQRGGSVTIEGAKRVAVQQMEDVWALLDEAAIVRLQVQTSVAQQRRSHLMIHVYVWGTAAVQQSTATSGSSSTATYSELIFVEVGSAPHSLLTEESQGNPPVTEGQAFQSRVTLQRCLKLIGEMGSDYSPKILERLPTQQSLLTMLLQPALKGMSQLILIGCVSPCRRCLQPSITLMTVVSAVRYARFPALQRLVDPNIKYAQLLSQELSQLKSQIKALESKASSASNKSSPDVATKAVLLQRLLEVTEELQDVTMTDDAKRSYFRTLQAQRQRALQKIISGGHPIRVMNSVHVVRLRSLFTTVTDAAFDELAAFAPPSVMAVCDGDCIVGVSDMSQVILKNIPDRIKETLKKHEQTMRLSMLIGTNDEATLASNVALLRHFIESPSVAAMHAMIVTSELQQQCWLTVPTISGCTTASDRTVTVNGKLWGTQDGNIRLHHLDRVVVGPWAFQVILPLHWLADHEEREALMQRSVVEKVDTAPSTESWAPKSLQDKDVRSALSGLSADRMVEPGKQGLQEWNPKQFVFQRAGTMGRDHCAMIEAFDRVSTQMEQLDESFEIAKAHSDVSGGGGGTKAAEEHAAQWLALAEQRHALGELLSSWFPAVVDGLDSNLHPTIGYVAERHVAAAGAKEGQDAPCQTFRVVPNTKFDMNWIVRELLQGGALDQRQAQVVSVPVELNDEAKVEVLSTTHGKPSTEAAGVDDIFDELDALILGTPSAKETARAPTECESQDAHPEIEVSPRVAVEFEASTAETPPEEQSEPDPAVGDPGESLPPQHHADPADGVVVVDEERDAERERTLPNASSPAPKRHRRRSVAFVVPPSDDDEPAPDEKKEVTEDAEPDDEKNKAETTAANGQIDSDRLASTESIDASLSDAEKSYLAQFTSALDAEAAVAAVRETLQREIASFLDELKVARRWKPSGPVDHQNMSKPSAGGECALDKQLYVSGLVRAMRRGDIPKELILCEGLHEIFKLRIRKSLFHRGGFYPVEAVVAKRQLFYFDRSSGDDVDKRVAADKPCAGSCYLYGARLELLSVGEMTYCIQISPTAPRKGSHSSASESDANRLVLGFSTRPLQLEWLEKLRVATLPVIPPTCLKYLGGGDGPASASEAARYLLLQEEKEVAFSSAFVEPARSAAGSGMLNALVHLELGQHPVAPQMLPSDETTQSEEAALKHRYASPEVLALQKRACANGFMKASPPSSNGAESNHLDQQLMERGQKPAQGSSRATLWESALQQRLADKDERHALANAAAVRLFRGEFANNVVGSRKPKVGNVPPTKFFNSSSADPRDIIRLREVHNVKYLKYYHRCVPKLALTCEVGRSSVMDEFELVRWHMLLLRGDVIDGNMTAVERSLLREALIAAQKQRAGADRAPMTSMPELDIAIAPRTTPHYFLVDMLQSTVEVVDVVVKKAAVFQSAEVMSVSRSRRDPTVAMVVLLHVKPFLYFEQFGSFEERERFVDCLEMIRGISPLYAPWLIPPHRRMAPVAGMATVGGADVLCRLLDAQHDSAACQTYLVGWGEDAVTLASGANRGDEPFAGELSAGVPGPATGTSGILTDSKTPSGAQVRLEGEVMCSVSSELCGLASVWVGCWNLGGVPLMSRHAVDAWVSLTCDTTECADVMVFSLQRVGGVGERAPGRTVAPTEVTMGERFASALTQRLQSGKGNASGTWMTMHLVAAAKTTEGDVILVIAKAPIVLQIGCVSCTELPCCERARDAGVMATGLGFSCMLGRSTVAVLSVRLPATSVGLTAAARSQLDVWRQAHLAAFVSQMNLHNAFIDVIVGSDAFIVCGDFGDAVCDCRPNDAEEEAGEGVSVERLSAVSAKTSLVLNGFAMSRMDFPPPCPVILGSTLLDPRSTAGSNPSSANVAVRSAAYSGRVLYRRSAAMQLGSCVSLMSSHQDKGAAVVRDGHRSLMIAETLPCASQGFVVFRKNAPIAFEPPTMAQMSEPRSARSRSQSMVKRAASGDPEPVFRWSMVSAKVGFVIRKFRIQYVGGAGATLPPRLVSPRLYVTTRYGLSPCQSVELMAIASSSAFFEATLKCTIECRTRDPILLGEESVLLSLLWGLSGSSATLYGTMELRLVDIERAMVSPSDDATSNPVVTLVRPMQRCNALVGDVTVDLSLIPDQ